MKSYGHVLYASCRVSLWLYICFLYISCVFHDVCICFFVVLGHISQKFRRSEELQDVRDTCGFPGFFLWTLLSKSWTNSRSRVYLYIPQWLSNFLLSMHTCFRYSILYVHIYIIYIYMIIYVYIKMYIYIYTCMFSGWSLLSRVAIPSYRSYLETGMFCESVQ